MSDKIDPCLGHEILMKACRREIKELKGQKKRLEDMLFKLGAMSQAPCFVCGYRGDGYYQPDKHRCAARHQKLCRVEGKEHFIRVMPLCLF